MKKYTVILFTFVSFAFIFSFNLNTNFASASSSPAAYCTINSTLRVGSRGAEVVCLQTSLSGLVVDGSFGVKTKTAVIAWQTSKGLVADGIFGAKSRAAWVNSVSNFPEGCTSAVGYSVTTGLPCGVTSFIRVISPNGGETWQKETTETIRWQDNTPLPECSTSPIAPCLVVAPSYDIKLVPYYPPCTSSICPKYNMVSPYIIATSVSDSSYNWSVGNVWLSGNPGGAPESPMIAPDGQYTIQICQTGSTICDSSNAQFAMTSPSALKVVTPNGGEVLHSNSVYPITWSTTGSFITSPSYETAKIDLYLDWGAVCSPSSPNGASFQCPPSYLLDKDIPISPANRVYNWIVATDIDNMAIPVSDNYSIRVCMAGSTTNCDSSDRVFSIIK